MKEFLRLGLFLACTLSAFAQGLNPKPFMRDLINTNTSAAGLRSAIGALGATNAIFASNIVSGGVIPNGTLATNSLEGGFLIQTGDKRKHTFDGGALTNLNLGAVNALTNNYAASVTLSSNLTVNTKISSPMHVGATYNPFDPRTTYLVQMGDSIPAETANPCFMDTITNLPAWKGLLFFTNQSVGGQTLFEQSNIFYTTTLALLPSMAANGTNVIISVSLGGNDIIRGTNGYVLANMYSNFFADLTYNHGYTVVCASILPRTAPLLYPNNLVFNEWLYHSTNVVYAVPDFARVLPDAATNNIMYSGDGVHPNARGQYELALEWDRSVRFRRHPYPQLSLLPQTSDTNIILTLAANSGGMTAHMQDWSINGTTGYSYVDGQSLIHGRQFILNDQTKPFLTVNFGGFGDIAAMGSVNTGVFGDGVNAYLAFKSSGTERWRILNTGDFQSQVSTISTWVNGLRGTLPVSGNDKNGYDLTISPGPGSGAGNSGNIIFQVSTNGGASSSSVRGFIPVGMINSNGIIAMTNGMIIKTNFAAVDISTGWLTTLATRTTNSTRRADLRVVVAFNDAVGGTPQFSVNIEDNGTTNSYPYTIPGTLALSITNTVYVGLLGPGAVVTATDTSYGTGASVSIVSSTLKGQ